MLYNANPDLDGGVEGRWPDGALRRAGGRRRSWAVLGEMAELGEDAIAEHDRIGRLAVRLDVSRLIVVGTGRSMSAMHQGGGDGRVVGSESVLVPDRRRRARVLLAAELSPGDVVLVAASNAAGWVRLPIVSPSRERAGCSYDPAASRDRACGVDRADARAHPTVHQAGVRAGDPRGWARPAIRRSAAHRRWAGWPSWPASGPAIWARIRSACRSAVRAPRHRVCWCCAGDRAGDRRVHRRSDR